MSLIDLLGEKFPAVFDGPGTKYWFRHASLKELDSEHEKCRIAALNGDEEAEKMMNKIADVMHKKRNEEYRKNHPNSKTVHREHGWYISKDD